MVNNLPKLGKNTKFCLFAQEEGKDERNLVPLKKVSVKAELRGPTAVTSVELTYVNPMEDNPLECTYVLPLDKATILSKFEA